MLSLLTYGVILAQHRPYFAHSLSHASCCDHAHVKNLEPGTGRPQEKKVGYRSARACRSSSLSSGACVARFFLRCQTRVAMNGECLMCRLAYIRIRTGDICNDCQATQKFSTEWRMLGPPPGLDWGVPWHEMLHSWNLRVCCKFRERFHMQSWSETCLRQHWQ